MENRCENRGNQRNNALEKRCRDIIVIMRRDPKVSMAGIARELNISVQQVERAVAKMQKEKRIEHRGPAKGGSWAVLE